MKNKLQFYPLKWLHILFLMAASNVLFACFCQEQTKQQVLIVTGGHEFEREAFFDIFEDMTDVEYKEVIQPQANQVYDSSLVDDFDVLVFYDMFQEIDDSQELAFRDVK